MFDYLEDDRFDVYLSHDHPDHTLGLTWVRHIFWKKATEAGVGRLVLIHLSSFRPEHGEPELDHACPIFPRTKVAFDGMEIEF
jgi:ribonuclease BN (tRNA processing enzyme)